LREKAVEPQRGRRAAFPGGSGGGGYNGFVGGLSHGNAPPGVKKWGTDWTLLIKAGHEKVRRALQFTNNKWSTRKYPTGAFYPAGNRPSHCLRPKLLQEPQLAKYRCYLCMSSQNHYILYFRCIWVTLCRKLRHSPVENPRTPLRLWVRPGPRGGEEAGS